MPKNNKFLDFLKRYKWIILILILGLIIRGTLVSLGPEKLLKISTDDDFYYYAKTAENIANGKGITYDGITPTAGFHPLYAFTFSLGFMMFKSELGPLYFALIISSIANILVALFIYLILKKYSENAAIIAALFWIINPFAFFMSVNGMETSLYLMFFVMTIWYYLKMKDRRVYSAKDGLCLGLLLGLTYLARADAIFLAGAIFIDQLIMWIKDKAYEGAKNILQYRKNYFFLTIAIGFLIMATPWFIFNIVNFGSIQPDSNIAIQVLEYSKYFSSGFDYVKLALVIAQQIISVPFVLIMMLGFGKFYIKSVDGYLNVLHVTLSLAICGMLAAYIIVKRKKFLAEMKRYKDMWFLLILFIFFMYYPIVLLRGSTPRYFAPIFILCMIILSIILAFVIDNMKSRIRCIKFIVLAICVIFMVFTFLFIRANLSQDWQGEMYQGARWLEANTPQNATIGSPDSGIFGYYSHRRIINLDGVMNRNAAIARRDKNLTAYIDSQNIDYLIDSEVYLQQFNNETNGQLFGQYKEIYRIKHTPEIHDTPGVSSDVVVMKRIN